VEGGGSPGRQKQLTAIPQKKKNRLERTPIRSGIKKGKNRTGEQVHLKNRHHRLCFKGY